MDLKKKIFFGVVVCFVVIQFIQPARNKSKDAFPTDMERMYLMSGNVKAIFRNACYDCHSDNTRYPWYSSIQPGAWYMSSHISNGRKELNFNRFGEYSVRRQASKLKAIANSINDKSMPVWSYTLVHRDAVLSEDQVKILSKWISKTLDSLAVE